jgi:hypothetical protein
VKVFRVGIFSLLLPTAIEPCLTTKGLKVLGHACLLLLVLPCLFVVFCWENYGGLTGIEGSGTRLPCPCQR